MTHALQIIGIATLASLTTVLCCGCFLVSVMAIKYAVWIWRDKHFMKGDTE